MLTAFFEVPLHDNAAKLELNRFLSAHRVLNIRYEFVQNGLNSLWAVCVVYARVDEAPSGGTAGAKSIVDYRDVLPDDQFQLFVKLREARNARAVADGIAPYNVFNNEHLADMIRRDIRSLAELKKLPGVGDARVKKYGQDFINMLQALRAEGNGESSGSQPEVQPPGPAADDTPAP